MRIKAFQLAIGDVYIADSAIYLQEGVSIGCGDVIGVYIANLATYSLLPAFIAY